MKRLKECAIMGILLCSTIFVSAQSESSTLVVSKGVQHVANKQKFEADNQRKSHIQAKSVEVPAIVVSKGIAMASKEQASGNIESQGYPAWTISKGVARQGQEKIHQNKEPKEYPEKGILSNDGNEISKKY